MGAKTGISWTGSTWTPIRARNLATGAVGWHCEPVSPACDHCYAEAVNIRLGTGLPFKPGHIKDIELFLDETMLLWPIRWKKPRKIFPCSMTDIFGRFVPDDMIDRMFGVMALREDHTFQVLTKRPERMERYFAGYEEDGVFYEGIRDALIEGAAQSIYAGLHEEDPSLWLAVHSPLSNVLLGCSVEDQRRADERREPMRILSELGWKTWVSYEPALEVIDWTGWEFLKWIVCGAESGREARPMNEACATSALRWCRRTDTAFYMKQFAVRGRAITDISKFPEGLQVQEHPE